MKRSFLIAGLLLAGCHEPRPADYYVAEPAPAPAEISSQQKQAQQAEAERQRRIDAARQSDPALNWVRIGITTGKFSESISSTVHKTYAECVASGWSEANTCHPIAALPKSYWDAERTDR